MSESDRGNLRDMQLAFVGKLMAGLSHENKNHLAIIRELNGLTGDLISLEDSLPPSNLERFEKNIEGIDVRIQQAGEMCRFLSRFSHRMDQPLSSFNVAEVLEEEIYLIKRFAMQKQVGLDFSSNGALPSIYNNPALLQFVVFCIVGPALDSLAKDGRISVEAVKHDNGAKIVITTTGPVNKTEEHCPWEAVLPEALRILGAEYSRSVVNDANQQVVFLVSSLAEYQSDS